MVSTREERPGTRRIQFQRGLLPNLIIWTFCAVIFGVFVLIEFAKLASSHWMWEPEFSLDSSQWYDVARSAIATTGLFGLGGAALLAYRRQKTSEVHHELEKDVGYRARYAQAAEQLGHKRAAVRLAGVYAMAALADDWRNIGDFKQQEVCVNILCAYLRMPYDPDFKDRIVPEKEVRLTIIREITERLQAEATDSWSDLEFDFSGVVFDSGDFSKVIFNSRVRFKGARFYGEVSFDDAQFNGQVSFDEARFTEDCRVSFYDARFNKGCRVNFKKARFNKGCRVSFYEAHFNGGNVDFIDARFAEGCHVNFSEAQFNGGKMDFYAAHFNGGDVLFMPAHFNGGDVDFSEAQFNMGCRVNFYAAHFNGGNVNFYEAHFNGGIVDFEYPSSWAKPPLVSWGNGAPPEGIRPVIWPPKMDTKE